ncbi:hypothetical protein ATJ88_0955 [Isoptericola jiangsuensis]|uniref:Uncharacterized protein n=1 Tax=Isoptericola jiangsuensis TaxID=548579 RepID=A0A2A9ETT0_9MICO|nr:hypothetical protein [Isoptericola jiangsuensis]PFG42298.1 hypothetical protein ATJ88_0955 [Isoptericola jiangsuensis]
MLAAARDGGLDVGRAVVLSELVAEPVETPTIRTARGFYALQAVAGVVVAEEVVRLAAPTPRFAGGPPFVLQADPAEPGPDVLRRLLDATRLPGFPEGERDVRLDGTLALSFTGERDGVTTDRQTVLR